MEEMSKNLTEMKQRNKYLEKKLNDLTKEVRGYKDAVSEHTGSNNGRNTPADLKGGKKSDLMIKSEIGRKNSSKKDTYFENLANDIVDEVEKDRQDSPER